MNNLSIFWLNIILIILHFRWTIILGIGSLVIGQVWPLIFGIVIDILHYASPRQKRRS